MQWYYAINGQRLGPVTETEFEQLVREGTIRSDTLVWRQGMPNWVAYSLVVPAQPAATASVEGAPEEDTAICAVSGKRYPKREMIQYEGKWISAEHRDAYFQRQREGVAGPGEFLYAGFWIRFLAKVLDGLLLGVVLMGVYFALAFGVFSIGTLNPEDPNAIGAMLAMQAIFMVSNIVLGLLYNWFFVSRYAATPGKMVLGLKIVRSDGSLLSNGRIVARFFGEFLSGMIFYIGYLIAAFDDQKRSLHDHICDSRVIKKR